MKRTTLLLEEEQILTLEEIAKKKGITKAQVLRDAIAAYVAKVLPSKAGLPSFAGCGASRYKGSLGEESEKLLDRRATRQGWK